jgi:hypothetical protein
MPYDSETGAFIEAAEIPADLTDGAPEEAPEGADPRQASIERFDRLIRQGATREVAAAEAMHVIAQAGLAGDKRVIVDDNWTRREPWDGPQQ